MAQDDGMTLGGIIKSLRASAGLTQIELAARARVSESLIVSVENDKRLLGTDNLEAVASALGASESERANLVAARLRQKRRPTEPTNADLDAKLDRLIELVEKLDGTSKQRRDVAAKRTPSMPRPAVRGPG